MRLIDATEVVKNIVAERDEIPYELVSEKPFKHGNSMRGGIRKALRCIEQAPTVDAVPVVRCRECKHLNVVNRKELYAHCPKTNTVFLPFELDIREHFCSLGERKEGADNDT